MGCRFARDMLPRRRAARSFFLAFALVAGVHLVTQLAGAETDALLTQVLLMPLLAGVLWARRRHRVDAWSSSCSSPSACPGSVTAPPSSPVRTPEFVVMVGLFLLAQLAYIAAFWPFREHCVLFVHRLRLLGESRGGRGAPRRVRRRRRRAARAGPRLRCLPGHHGRARHRWNRLTAVGSAVFLVSDGLIALDIFVPAFGLPARDARVMATYVVAQALLVAGVVNEPPGPSPTAIPTDAVRAR